MKFRRGLTLIEILISIAILSILIVAVLGIFNTGLTSISKSGIRTERILKVREEVDKKIKENENKTNGEDIISVTMPGFAEDMEIKGVFIEEIDHDDPNIKISTFVPNKKQD